MVIYDGSFIIVIGIFCVIFIIVAGVIIESMFPDIDGKKKAILILIITAFVILVIVANICLTESGKRKLKTFESNFTGGICRVVKVYDVEGDIIAEYKGKFDIEYDENRILFDDENGLRHIIYYPTGNIIIDEVSEWYDASNFKM